MVRGILMGDGESDACGLRWGGCLTGLTLLLVDAFGLFCDGTCIRHDTSSQLHTYTSDKSWSGATKTTVDLSAQSSAQMWTCQHNHQHKCGPVSTIISTKVDLSAQSSAQLWTCQHNHLHNCGPVSTTICTTVDLSAQSSAQLWTCQHNHQHNCGPVSTIISTTVDLSAQSSAQLWTCQHNHQHNCGPVSTIISRTVDLSVQPPAQLLTRQHNYSTPVYICQHNSHHHNSQGLMQQNQVKSNV